MHRLSRLQMVDYDKLFYSDSDAKVVPCGTVTLGSDSPMDESKKLFFQSGAQDLSHISTCECGNLVGNFYEGSTCKVCHTIVETNFSKELKFRLWLEIPEFAPPLMHPVAYTILSRWLGNHKRVPILDLILDTETELPPELKNILGQGYKYFHDNFDDIMRYFLNEYPKNNAAIRKKSKYIPEFLQMYRDRMFIRHIPILNQSLHLMTSSGTMMYGDDTVEHILKCKIQLSSMIDIYNNGNFNDKFVNQRMWDIHKSFVEYTKTILNNKLLQKPGHIRRNIIAARMHCTARCVIVPISKTVEPDEIFIPWVVGVTALSLEIMNVLMNRMDYTMPDAKIKVDKALYSYDSEIDEIFKTLISECRYKGLPVLMGRNPSLRHGAIFLLFVTKVKTSFDDNTIDISPLLAPAPNFDFDGDAMHVHFVKEMGEVPKYMAMHPSTVLLGSNIGISSDICITNQAVMGLNGWLNSQRQFQ